MPSRARSVLASTVVAVCVLVVGVVPAAATEVPQPLPFEQDWSNTELITANDDWSGVPGIVGFLGQGLTSSNDVDPQTVLGQSTIAGDVDVLANQANPDITNGGVAEFFVGDQVVALQGSGTADAPYILMTLNTTGVTGVTVEYNLEDIDGSGDDAVQQVALQFRVGTTGAFTNVPAGYVADATTGPDLADLVTPVSVELPATANNQQVVQVRVITTNATASDEWVGVDDISITSGEGDAAPAVQETTPANGAVEVPVDSGISITFTEAVTVTDDAFAISCSTSGDHEATVTGASPTFTLDPTDDLVQSETCTVTVFATEVTDQDATDPPDTMAADHVFSFSTETPPSRIHEIQGASQVSATNGLFVHDVPGIVVARSASGFWFQDPSPDADDETSEGLFVFTGGPPAAAVGDSVSVAGTVVEFRPGGANSTNLTTTEISNPGRAVVVVSNGNALPAPTVIGDEGRVPPGEVIDDDATGSVETSGSFDAATDGIDFYESLEGMRVQVNDALAVGPTNGFGEIPVVADGGASASVRSARGGVLARAGDFNPERVHLDDALIFPTAMPAVDVGDSLGTVTGVLDYSFANFKLLVDAAPTVTSGGLERETGAAAKAGQLTVATFNVENLDPGDPAAKFDELAGLIVDNLGAPDLLSLEEVQDDNGPTNDSIVTATATYAKLIAAIANPKGANGPTYEFRQIDPVDDQDGGETGGNIRVGFLFRTDRGLAFVDRPGGGPTVPTSVFAGPRLSSSPGRIDPGNAAFAFSRKPLAGEFTYLGETLFVVANHFNSKTGDDPLFGRFQPPTRVTETQRHQQAQVVNDFIDAILAEDADANVLVLGDLNDFDFSDTLTILRGGVLTNLYTLLPASQRYSYDFEGNSQALDHVLMSSALGDEQATLDVVRVNAEFAAQTSDHDPLLAGFCLDGTAPTLTVTATPNGLWPPNHNYVRVEATWTATDTVDPTPTVALVSATSSEPDNAPGGADGNTVDDVVKIDDDTFDLRAERNENGSGRTYTLTYRAVDDCGNATTGAATVRVPITFTG
jgi:predicted extracellular nuclease